MDEKICILLNLIPKLGILLIYDLICSLGGSQFFSVRMPFQILERIAEKKPCQYIPFIFQVFLPTLLNLAYSVLAAVERL